VTELLKPKNLSALTYQGFQRAQVNVSRDAQSHLCRELLHYWDRLRGAIAMPNLEDLKLDQLGSVASWLTLKEIKVAETGEVVYTNLYWGESLSQKLGFDGNNHDLSDYSGTRGGQAMSTIYGFVIEHVAPILSSGFLEFVEGCEDVGYEAIFLPLASKGSRFPSHIIAAYDFSYEPDLTATA